MSDEKPVQISSSQSLMYSGPLPPANEFAGYDKALPGTAERLLLMAEKEVDHRHKKEDKALAILSRGQIMALIISTLSLGVVSLSIGLHQPEEISAQPPPGAEPEASRQYIDRLEAIKDLVNRPL